MTTPEFPDLVLFDSRRARRAVRRGVFRTVGLVLVVLAVLSMVAAGAGKAIAKAAGRDGALQRVGEQGVQVGHPYLFASSGLGRNFARDTTGFTTGLTTTVTNTRIARTFTYSLRSSVTGHLSLEGNLYTELDRALQRGRPTREIGVEFLRSLPAMSLTAAVVEFTTPMDGDKLAAAVGLKRFNDLTGIGTACFYLDPFAAVDGAFVSDQDVFDPAPVSWPCSPDEPSFQDWTRRLRSSDTGNLHALGLPSAEVLKQAAAANEIHAVLAIDLTPEQLRSTMSSPLVRSLTPVDVRIDLLDLGGH